MTRREKCFICMEAPVKHKESGVCGACYSWLYYWRRKSVTEWVQYIRANGKRDARIAKIAPHNITSIKGKRRA